MGQSVKVACAMRFAGLVALLSFCVSCQMAPLAQHASHTSVDGTDGQPHTIPSGPPDRLTVLVFFSKHCQCLSAHDERLRRLYERYRSSGVQFFAVDSEVSSTLSGDREEAARRSYPFSILMDPMARLARALGAQSASYAVILDTQGDVRYEGGIDSDKTHLRDDAIPFLANAIDDLLANHPVRLAATSTVGCALHTALDEW